MQEVFIFFVRKNLVPQRDTKKNDPQECSQVNDEIRRVLP